MTKSTAISWDRHITRSAYFQIEESKPETASKPKPVSLLSIMRRFNRGLRRSTGLEIRRTYNPQRSASSATLEDVSFGVSQALEERRRARLVEALLTFFGELAIRAEPAALDAQIRRYNELFRTRPVRDLRFGTGYNNGLVVFCFFRTLSPSQVIELGVWRGFSTYLIDSALSENASICSFDISFEQVVWKSERAAYFERDVTDVELRLATDTVGFFDDHVSHYDRIHFCQQRGIRTIVLDDDVSVETVHSDGWPPLPTASMIMDYDNIPKVIEWCSHGKRFRADLGGLDVSAIRDRYLYVRMPDLFPLTGYRNSSQLSFLVEK